MSDRVNNSGLPPTLERKVKATKRSMWMERFVRAFWPAWVVLAVLLSALVLDIFNSLGLYGKIVATLLLGAGTIYAVYHAGKTLHKPTRHEALKSLDASLPSNAASALDEDILIGGQDDAAQSLWQSHRARLSDQAAGAVVPKADLSLTRFDPWSLRYAALGVLVCSLAFSRFGGAQKIAQFLSPGATPAQAAILVPALEAWVAPPPYTGRAPVYLTEKDGQSIIVPAGSILTLRATGLREAPALNGIDGAAFAEEAAQVFGASAELASTASVSVMSGAQPLGSWNIEVTADSRPEVTITEAPAPTDEHELTFAYLAEDDYGIASARGMILPDRSGMTNPPAEEETPFELSLEAPTPFEDEIEPVTYQGDLTAHPLAGLPVLMRVAVEDAAGQSAQTEQVAFTLPARPFTEPMAKALIEQRRILAWDIRKAWDVLDLLEAATDYPDDYFRNAKSYLTTSMAIKRLHYALENDTIAAQHQDIIEMLWEAALRLEEGDLDDAFEQLQAAQRRLQDALERGASDEEIARLTEELRQAMNDYIDQLVQQAMRQPPAEGQQGQQQSGDNQSLSREDLERMLEELENMAQSGAREQAEQMLSMLGQMLENLQMQQAQSGQGGFSGSPQEQALQDMMRRQQELADDTFGQLQDEMQGGNQPGQQGQDGQDGQQQGQQGQGQQPGQQGQGQQGQGQQGQGQQGQGQQPSGQQGSGQSPGNQQAQSGGGGSLQGNQEGLRGDLNSLLPGVGQDGEAGQALREAERDMGAASDNLGEGDLNAALDDQARALDRLREGAQQLAQEQNQGQQPGQQGQSGQSDSQTGDVAQNAEQLDPFGRIGRSFGPDDGDGVDVPGERARNRALEIQREIRKREADRERPEAERDYLKRLQDRF